MPTAYIIVGNDWTRKSSTIRALTGATRQGVRTIATNQGDIDIFVQITSLHESNIRPQEFIDYINSNNHDHVLVPLWLINNGDLPDGFTYIQYFLNAGWNIQEIMIFNIPTGSLTPPPNFPPLHYIERTQVTAANEIASRIRSRWEWL